MFRIIIAGVVLAAAAWAGPSVGAVAGELGLGFVGVAVGVGGPALAIASLVEDPENSLYATAAVGGCAGCALGVWLGGEWLDGRSDDPLTSFLGAGGGAAVGIGASAACFYLMSRPDDHTDENEGTWLLPAVACLIIVTPALATAGYNLAKNSSASSALPCEIAPAVAALPPCDAGEKTTLTFGVALTF